MILLLYYFLKCICNLREVKFFENCMPNPFVVMFSFHVFQRKTGERLVLNFLQDLLSCNFQKSYISHNNCC